MDEIKIHCAYKELVDINSLQPHPNNANRHPEDQIEVFKKIILFNGVRRPITVSTRSGYITKGHGELETLKSLGMEKVPVDYQDYDSELQEIADMNADNALSRMSYLDTTKMQELVVKLDELNFDLELAGIPQNKAEILATQPPAWFAENPDPFFGSVPQGTEPEPKQGLTDDDEVPEIKIETDIKPGDLFQLGEHRLLCGDSTDKAQVERLMDGEKADMVFTDPPYGVAVQNTQGSIIGDEDLTVFKNSLPLLKSFAKANAHFYVWCASGNKLPESIESFASIFQFQNLLPIRCTHENKRGKKGAFKLNYETCLFANDNTRSFNFSKKFKVSETTINDSRYNGDGNLRVYPALWDGERSTEHNMNIVHPTQKKVEMIEFYLEISSSNSESVMDLFGGSGSTLIACEKTNRKCFMMELDPQYCQVIIDRWEGFTGQKAVKIS